jgi:hypothetical protein
MTFSNICVTNVKFSRYHDPAIFSFKTHHWDCNTTAPLDATTPEFTSVLIGITSSGISDKLKVHNGKIEIISFVIKVL